MLLLVHCVFVKLTMNSRSYSQFCVFCQKQLIYSIVYSIVWQSFMQSNLVNRNMCTCISTSCSTHHVFILYMSTSTDVTSLFKPAITRLIKFNLDIAFGNTLFKSERLSIKAEFSSGFQLHQSYLASISFLLYKFVEIGVL